MGGNIDPSDIGVALGILVCGAECLADYDNADAAVKGCEFLPEQMEIDPIEAHEAIKKSIETAMAPTEKLPRVDGATANEPFDYHTALKSATTTAVTYGLDPIKIIKEMPLAQLSALHVAAREYGGGKGIMRRNRSKEALMRTGYLMEKYMMEVKKCQ